MPNSNLEQMIERLNPQQKEATLHVAGPELIIAGAGSGKTSVLTTRIAMLMDMGVLPERILALTFTKKAAEEMRKRIIEMEGKDALRLRMGTFHSVFISFLRPYSAYLGFPENFTILDEDDSTACLKRCIKAVVEQGRPPLEDQTKQQIAEYKKIDSHYKPKTIKEVISNAKNDLVTADAYAASIERQRSDERQKRPLTGRIFLDYRDACFRTGTMDFDDILLYTDILLANNPQVCAELAANFDYILVDEYQDTNGAQYSILRRLTYRNKNICVVGDDSQSIYAFRGAKIANIFNFQKEYAGCKTVKLERNYRSTRTIVDSANTLIGNNANRIPKKCFSEAEEGSPIDIYQLPTDRDEAMLIADTITAEMKKNPELRYKDFAILYRTNSQSRILEDSLIRRRIPYMIYSGTSFFERMEVKDQMAYFKLAVNPNDDESFRRVVNKPVRGVGDTGLSLLAAFARENNISLWQVINDSRLETLGLKKRPLEGLAEFRDIINRCIELAGEKQAYTAAYEITNLVGFFQEYVQENSEESHSRADNLRELVDSVKGYEDDINGRNRDLDLEHKENSTLAGYLQNALLLSNADSNSKDDDKVNLMTVHCAKGLEFHSVFVSGMEKGLFPLERENGEDETEEERRLFYVAVTRAKKQLTITHTEKRMRFGRWSDAEPSPFIAELLGEEPEYENIE